ncbi:MAG TPA: FAD-dependent oxidoreductase [Phycisphaerales bacterium]|nr:FAD-dependent oxidoreductase [Phycisphaerales bacterium]
MTVRSDEANDGKKGEFMRVWGVLRKSVLGLLSIVVIGGMTGSSVHAEGLLRYYFPPEESLDKVITTQVCIYGGTSAGVVAALELKRLGIDSVIVHPGVRIGGLTASGLGWTDFGTQDAVQGIAREFYERVGATYDMPIRWTFEPSVALAVFEEMVAEAGVEVYDKAFLDRAAGVKMEHNRIVSLTTENGLTVRAAYFIDATYEGDLMAAAGVSYTTGRESNSVYDETYNGRQVRQKHQFLRDVSPYIVEGDPSSGLLGGIETEIPVQGQGDHRIQAYNFRICMTDQPDNRVPFPKPANYDRSWYILLERYFAAGFGTDVDNFFQKFDRIPNGKTDTNNHGGISTDFIGQNYDWPTGSYQTREQIYQQHVGYIQGYWWFVANDPVVGQVAPTIQARLQNWGLAADEFVEYGHWPPQLYVREARRMVSDYVITEHDFFGRTRVSDSVGLASYGMDSHNCARFVTAEGYVKNEGDVQIGGIQPYRLSYRAIVPRRGECANLAVPVCVSASHIAYGSVRMEPVFMILAQSSAAAIAQAIDSGGVDLQSVDIKQLQRTLEQRGQRLVWGTYLDDVDGTIIDSEQSSQVIVTGDWLASSSVAGFVGEHYLHDDNTGKGEKSVVFQLHVPASGSYDVYLCWTEHDNRATQVPVSVHHGGGQSQHTVNQRTNGGRWNKLGRYVFSEGAGSVVISNAGTDGYVVVDAVLFSQQVSTCDDLIRAGQVLPGDISGPAGKPDCYVNIYDLAEMARQWLFFLNKQKADPSCSGTVHSYRMTNSVCFFSSRANAFASQPHRRFSSTQKARL